MFDDDWRLESKEVSPLVEELSLFDRPNEVERGRILEEHRLEPILQQQNFTYGSFSSWWFVPLLSPAFDLKCREDPPFTCEISVIFDYEEELKVLRKFLGVLEDDLASYCMFLLHY
ncbi:hypothetical protein Tco_0651483 [Tanacetum coccineum]|uniref:Uncharacterized protein n=1 Tax=Tanacetum coccineum TaxID=301880 RepID=A0ABQ4WUX1_9ASTR